MPPPPAALRCRHDADATITIYAMLIIFALMPLYFMLLFIMLLPLRLIYFDDDDAFAFR